MENTVRRLTGGIFQFHSLEVKCLLKNTNTRIYLLLNLLIVSSVLVKSTNGQYLAGYPPGYNGYQQQPGMNQGFGIGSRDYGDECMNKPSILYNSDDSKLCDQSRGLYCPGTSQYPARCLCFVPGSIYRNGKCRAKVGRSCQGGDGSTIECVINAECTTLTKFCQCRRNYWSNDEGTACNHGHKLATWASPWKLFTFFACLTAYQLYRHAFWIS